MAGGKLSRKEMEGQMRSLIDNKEFLEASMTPLAELMKAKLDALIAAGFTRVEAMDLLKERGLHA